MAAHLAHLEALLDSVLATVAILSDVTGTRPAYSAHLQAVIKALAKHVTPCTLAQPGIALAP